MTIKEFFKGIVESIVLNETYIFEFIHGTKSWQNLIADELQFKYTDEDENEVNKSYVFMDDPIRWKYLFTPGSVLEKEYSLRLMINFKKDADGTVSSELDNTPEQHQVLVDLAVLTADKIVNKLRQNTSVKSVSADAIEFINFYDLNVDGVFLELKLIFRNSNSIC